MLTKKNVGESYLEAAFGRFVTFNGVLSDPQRSKAPTHLFVGMLQIRNPKSLFNHSNRHLVVY